MLNAQTSSIDMVPVETLPSNTELEQQVLGSLLSDSRLLERMGFLRPEHFFLPVHQRIFTAIREMCDAGRVASPVTLKAQFAQDEDLKSSGGAAYLARCAGNSAIIPVDSAREIVTLAQQRRLVESCRKAIASACEGKILPAHIALWLAEECEAVAQGSDDFRLEDDLVVRDRILKGLTEVLTPVSTGLARLDKAMDGGLYPGKAYAFAAEKKTGKTVLLSTISRNLAMRGVKHLFIAAEMGSDEIHQRVLAGIADVYPSAFRSDYGKSQEFQGKVAEAALKCRGNILYRNAPGLTFDNR